MQRRCSRGEDIRMRGSGLPLEVRSLYLVSWIIVEDDVMTLTTQCPPAGVPRSNGDTEVVLHVSGSRRTCWCGCTYDVFDVFSACVQLTCPVLRSVQHIMRVAEELSELQIRLEYGGKIIHRVPTRLQAREVSSIQTSHRSRTSRPEGFTNAD